MKLEYSGFKAGKSNLRILIAGLAIIIGTNVIALAGVAYNRSGEPEAQVELTERELGLPNRYRMRKENTGLALRINCRVEEAEYTSYGNANCWGTPAWLDQNKLRELGFETGKPSEQVARGYSNRYETPRKVYLVLEFDGAAHQRAVTNAEKELGKQQELLASNPGKKEFENRVEQAQQSLEREQHNNSRLFAIDAGRDKAALRNTYPDSGQYILMQALITAAWNYYGEKDWQGRISELLVPGINIPFEHRALFEALEEANSRGNRGEPTPRYKVRVAFGKRVEPWVVGVGKR